MLRRIALEFVIDLVLQARPEIHRYRTDLNLHLYINSAVGQKYRNGHEHMIALIAARFRQANVILDCDDMNIILQSIHLRDSVNIRCKRTDNPDSRNVVDVIYHVVNRGVIAIPLQLLDNALRRFDARLDIFNRIVLMYLLKFVI